MNDMHVGYTSEELAGSPYARFYNPLMAPLQKQLGEALQVGPIAPELMYPVDKAPQMLSGEDWSVESGYAMTPDGAVRAFCLVEMPGVTPAMWDWWFAWHGSDPMRYRLWHPRAHVHVGWADGRDDLEHYVGRTSNIVEYLGSELVKLSISFITPASMGLDENILAERGEVAICARVSFSGTPRQTGWLLHHVRPVPGGAQMRSRMWVGGNNIAVAGWDGSIGKAIGGLLGRLRKLTSTQAAAVFVHGSQEMAHLASFLPELYEEFKSD